MVAANTSPIVRLSQMYLEPLLAGERDACRQIVDAALAELRAKGLAVRISGPDMRVPKHQHRLSEHVAAFVRFLKSACRISFDVPSALLGHAYLLYGVSERKLADDIFEIEHVEIGARREFARAAATVPVAVKTL